MARPKKNAYADYGISGDDLGPIRRKIQSALRFQKKEYESDADVLCRYYKGDQWLGSALADGDHQITVNRVLPNLELKVNLTAFRTPDFIVRPKDATSEMPAKVAKAALTYDWEQQGIQQQLKKAFRDGFILRYGVVWIGWKFETADECLTNERKPVEGEAPGSPEQMAALAAEGQDPFSSVPRAEVIVDAPCVKRVKPVDFILEPGCDEEMENARFVVWRERLPLDEVKANPRYKHTDKLKGSPLYDDTILPKDVTEVKPEDRPDDCRQCTLLHYYEKRRRLHCVYSDENWDDPLLVENWPWAFQGYPFEIVVPHVVPDEAANACPSDVELAKPLQDALNQTRSLQQNHMEQFNAAYQCRAGTLGPSARRALKSRSRGRVIEHNGGGDQGIFPLPHPPLQPEVYQVENASMRDLDYVLGVSDYQRNMMPQGGRRTATEVAAVQQTGSARVDNDVIEFSAFCERVAKKVLALLQQFAIRTRSLPIYDEFTNAQSFVDVDTDSIKGAYDLTVDVGSTQVLNKEAEQQKYLMLLQSLTPFLQMPDPLTGAPIINPVPLIRKIVELSGIKNAAEIVPPAAPPMQPGMPPTDPAMAGMEAPMDPAAGMADPMQALAAQLGGMN